MKRTVFRVLALGLTLMVCAGAAAQGMDDLSYTMAEKLVNQLNIGSGLVGTLTLNLVPVQGRESEAVSTVKPIALDWTFIKAFPDSAEGLPQETRLTLSVNASEYQQGSAELALKDGAVYLKSTLLDDGWYLLGGNALQTALAGAGVTAALPAAAQLLQTGGLLTGELSFFQQTLPYLLGANTNDLSGAMEQYTTKIDFWLEGYRSGTRMTGGEGVASVMEIDYTLPPAAVKSQLKQLLIDLMNDEPLLNELRALMPKEQADLYLEPSLQPYYFYAVDELPLNGDLQIHRAVSFQGDTTELSVTMPLVDSVSGDTALVYTRKKGAADMPDEQSLSVSGGGSRAEITFHTYDTMTGSSVYQGTLLYEGAETDGVKPQTYWAAFDLSSQTVTTRDLNGYETLNQNVKLSLSPAALPDGADAEQYAPVSKTDLSVDARFASLPLKTSPTDMTLKIALSGEGMAQSIELDMTGTTTAPWTPEALDPAQAADLAGLSQDDLSSLMTQAIIKGGLLFLPYLNLPQISPDPAQ